jgi:hypothetical protein
MVMFLDGPARLDLPYWTVIPTPAAEAVLAEGSRGGRRSLTGRRRALCQCLQSLVEA